MSEYELEKEESRLLEIRNYLFRKRDSSITKSYDYDQTMAEIRSNTEALGLVRIAQRANRGR